jgi:hypothetical protein
LGGDINSGLYALWYIRIANSYMESRVRGIMKKKEKQGEKMEKATRATY